MNINKSHSMWEQIFASGTCLFLPLATLPSDIEFNTTASWYGPGFHGKKTASGEIYDENKLTAANKELPFGTKLEVQNLKNGRSCVVVINDRGPYVHGRGIDLSREAARRIGMTGTAPVYCCTAIHIKSAVPAKQSNPKPQSDGGFQSVDVASLAAGTEPASFAESEALSISSSSHSSRRVPSLAVPHHRSTVRKHIHAFQYIAYFGSHRVQYDGVKTASRFVKNYRA